MVQVIDSPSRLLRTWLQDKFFVAGSFIHHHAGKVLFVGILALAASCAALKSTAIETRVDKLWVAGQSLLLSVTVYERRRRRGAAGDETIAVLSRPFRPSVPFLSMCVCLSFSPLTILSFPSPASQRMDDWRRS